MNSPHQIALNKAKINLMSRPDSAFFTTLCFSLKHLWDESIPAAATNGVEIRFSPEFYMGSSPEERVFLLLHETMHVAYLHMNRLGERDLAKWNAAADYVINLQLVERGFQMPKGGLLDYQYAGMSTEEVYKLLPEMKSSQIPMMDLESPPTNDPGEAGANQGNGGTPLSQAEAEAKLTEQVQDILIRAAIQSKLSGDKPGTIPGEIQIFLDGLLNPKLPWYRILQKYVQQLTKNDYSFRRPNRRHFPEHYLPSLHSETLMNIAVAVDTSGSVTDEEFHRFVSEMAAIFKMMKPEKITLIQFDTEIKSIDEIKNIPELMRCKFTGRGGTLIGPVLDWVRKNKPQLTLVFTDGYFRFYQEDKDMKLPFVWLIHEHPNFQSPFGKVIHYEV